MERYGSWCCMLIESSASLLVAMTKLAPWLISRDILSPCPDCDMNHYKGLLFLCFFPHLFFVACRKSWNLRKEGIGNTKKLCQMLTGENLESKLRPTKLISFGYYTICLNAGVFNDSHRLLSCVSIPASANWKPSAWVNLAFYLGKENACTRNTCMLLNLFSLC